MATALRPIVSIKKLVAGYRLVLACGHEITADTQVTAQKRFCKQCPKRWSKEHDHCINCGKVDYPPSNKGACSNCDRLQRRPLKNHVDSTYRRKYAVDDYVFEHWNERSAYLLGVLEAEGWISNGNGRHAVKLALSVKDEAWLWMLAEQFRFQGRITRYQVRKGQYAVRFTFSSPFMLQSLRRLGFRTSGLCGRIPDHVFHHFVRGYFDGDGSVFIERKVKSLKVSFAGSRTLLTSLRDRLHQLIGTSRQMQVNPKTNRPETCFSLTYAINDARRLGPFMYNNATLCLDRKRQRFER